MPFHWERDTITVSEISSILYEQYNDNPSVSIPIRDGSKSFDFKRASVPVLCNRCGHEYQIPPVLLLSMKEDRGYACSRCGNLSDSELQEKLKIDRLKIGRKTLIEEGIDPDSSEEEKSEEEQQAEHDLLIANAALEMDDSIINISDIENNSLIESSESSSAADDDGGPSPGVEPDSSIDEPEQESEDFGDLSEDENEDEGGGEGEEVQEEAEGAVYPGESAAEFLLNEEDIKEYGVEEYQEDEIEDDDVNIELNGKIWTIDELNDRYIEIVNALKKELGFIPFGDLKYDEGILKIACKICDHVIETNDIESLADTIKLDRKKCVDYGIIYSGDVSIHACPRCRGSIFNNGFNSFFRKKVEKIVSNRNLHIVNPESYLYANPLDSYVLEANGIKQKISFIDLCNKYKDADLSKHEMFTPRGTATKSEASSVDKDEKIKGEAVFSIPKFDPKSQFHFNAVNNPQESIYERQQKQAESKMVFHPSADNKKFRQDVAVLNADENPFANQKKINESFTKSVFYKFVEELAEECNVTFKTIIDQRTFEIPIVDFYPYKNNEPGFRLVCANLKENVMANVPYDKIAVSVPFSFKNNSGPMKYKYSVLFDDSIVFRERATFEALVKYVNPAILNYGGKRIELNGNVNVQYTDYKEYLDEFSRQCSPFPDGKPKNVDGELGIIASWIPEKEINSKDILHTLTALENRGMSKHSLDSLEAEDSSYMVCSIRFIKRLNEKVGKVIYTITEYIEIGNSLIADGFYQCLKALLKEYCIEFPRYKDRTPYIIVELDPNNYPSPSLNYYIKRGSLLPIDRLYKSSVNDSGANKLYSMNQVEQHLRYSYLRKREYRTKDADGMRKDMRKLNAPGLIRLMPEEIKATGLQKAIFDDVQRNIFIMNMGFVKATQLEIKEYFISQKVIEQIMLSSDTMLMNKYIPPAMILSNSGIVNNSGDAINSINSPYFNPAFAMKMGRMERGYATREAKEFYDSYFRQKQQQAFNEMAYNQNPNMQQMYPGGNFQNAQQPMTPGVFSMPRMPGMNQL